MAIKGVLVVLTSGFDFVPADKDNSRSLNKTDARTTTEETGLTTAGIEAYVTSLSNWGRWGDDDRIGTLNLITDEVRVAAAATIRTGRAVSLSRPIGSLDPVPVGLGFRTGAAFHDAE
jgi:hypothetical protein